MTHTGTYDLKTLQAALHSVSEMMVPGNDWRRELRALKRTAEATGYPILQKFHSLDQSTLRLRDVNSIRLELIAEIAKLKSPEGLEPAGYMYYDDDANGPFWTPNFEVANKYSASWQVWQKKRDHVCTSGLAYGLCPTCIAEGQYLY